MRRVTTPWYWIGIGFVLLLAFYAVTRLIRLSALPIFTDEAIYIRWSQIGMRDAAWRFISLTDGKQPMFTWIMMILLRVFDGADPLWVGRLTSVLAGAFTLAGIWVLSHELFRDRRLAWMASGLYIILPFALWYDRMALYDSLVSAFFVWNLYLAILLVKHMRLDVALVLGMLLGAGMLNKSTGFLSLYLLPFSLVLFDWEKKNRLKNRIRFFMLVIVAGVLSQMVYSVLRLSPFFHLIGQKDNVFVFSPAEWLNQPFRFLAGNLRGMFDWLRHYMTLPLFIAAFASWFLRVGRWRERLFLTLMWLLPFVALANFGKVLYPRYILFMAMPLIVLASYSILTFWGRVKRPLVRFVLLSVLLAPSVFLSGQSVLYPIDAAIPFSDRGQFMDDWPAGGGVREVVSYIGASAGNGKVHVFTEGTFGLMPYALEIYLVDHPNVDITGLWPLPDAMPSEIIQAASSSAVVYFVMNETQVAPPSWPMTVIGEYKKGKSVENKKLRLYRVDMPQSTAL